MRMVRFCLATPKGEKVILVCSLERRRNSVPFKVHNSLHKAYKENPAEVTELGKDRTRLSSILISYRNVVS